MAKRLNLTYGIHDDITARDYHADMIDVAPSLSASLITTLISQSPRHAWTEHPRLNPDHHRVEKGSFDLGTAAHEVWLLGNDHLVHRVEANDWRTKAAQEVRDRARAEGMVPLLTKEWKRVSAMLTAVRKQLPHLDVKPAMFTDGKAEQTLVWRDHGVLCRARADWLRDDHTAIDDLKTTPSANPHAWTRTTLWSIGGDIQLAFYLRGLKALTGVDAEFRFLLAETHPPYSVCPVSLAPDALALANDKIDRALEVWQRCLETDVWPSYPSQVCYAEAPPWREAEWQRQQEIEQAVAAA